MCVATDNETDGRLYEIDNSSIFNDAIIQYVIVQVEGEKIRRRENISKNVW